MINEQEQYIVTQLRNKIGLEHIPIYRNGKLIAITDVADNNIYDNRQYAYNANIFISDEVIYDLNSVESIRSIKTPTFSKIDGLHSSTSDLSYIFKMHACSEKRDTFIVPMVNTAFNLMQASYIGWIYKDYMQLVEKLWKSGKISQADKLEKIMNDRKITFNITFDNENTNKNILNGTLQQAHYMKTDLIVSNHIENTCEECSILQDRVYSISGKNKRYPALPKQVFEYGNFHKGCRHRFYPFIDGISKLFVIENSKFISVDSVKYSNRPYVDTRTDEEKEQYDQYCLKRQNEIDFVNLKREYYHKKYYDSVSVPKSFSAYMREKNFKHIL